VSYGPRQNTISEDPTYDGQLHQPRSGLTVPGRWAYRARRADIRGSPAHRARTGLSSSGKVLVNLNGADRAAREHRRVPVSI